MDLPRSYVFNYRGRSEICSQLPPSEPGQLKLEVGNEFMALPDHILRRTEAPAVKGRSLCKTEIAPNNDRLS
jgi:hypothetical protein